MTNFSSLKGVVGEQVINLAMLRLLLDKSEYHVFQNVPLSTKDGTAHINFIVASQYGVFMIETLNMQGRIFGYAEIDRWVEEFHKSKRTFPNPLKGIGVHANILRTILGLDAHKLFPVLSFVGGVSFKTPMPDHVTRTGGYVRYIKSKTMPIMTKADVARVVRNIEAYVEKHQHSQVQEQTASRICPNFDRNMLISAAKKLGSSRRTLLGKLSLSDMGL